MTEILLKGLSQYVIMQKNGLNEWLHSYRSLSSTYRSATSILVVDTPGFQNPGTCGRQSGASFEDLCFNYTQEKLQLLFHDLVFTMPQDRYSQVGY